MGAVRTEDVDFWFVWTKHGLPPSFAFHTATGAQVAARKAAMADPGHKYIVGHAVWKYGVPATPATGDTHDVDHRAAFEREAA